MSEPLINHISDIETLKNAGKYDEALSKIETLLRAHTTDYRLYEELADVLLYLGHTERAEIAVSTAQSLFPESATGMYLMGYIAITKGDFERGVRLLEEANKLFANNPEILRNLGWGYLMLGNTSKGIVYLKRALNLDPEDELIMEDLGVALISNGDIADGEMYLRRAGKEDKIRELRSMMNL